ncbi:MAG TPA: carbohydrate porin [Coleofasciculaceae cyanobacterium]
MRDAISTNDSSLHVEGFYQYQITDNIAITPGIIWITAPNGDNSNADIVTGVIRTTFTF